MFVTALCPTFRSPELIANTLALWRDQDYPIEQRRLVIVDDGGTYHSYSNDELSYDLYCVEKRFNSLPGKYNFMWRSLAPAETEVFLIWEHDDIYLPGYISGHVAALEYSKLSKPDFILTDHNRPGHLQQDNAAGRIHSSMAFRRSLLEEVGGWIETRRPDFDLQFIAKLQRYTVARDPWPNQPGEFVYGWHTNHPHGQHAMRTPDDEEWYDRVKSYYSGVFQPIVEVAPKYDNRTLVLLEAVKRLR